ncbi:hypothetical protein [Salinimicrobium flavum]|uniref:PH domain-containing protein n=1 Tax=Salinimicrobium flavum TaxID=1737065 RepID=A0ABW5ISQ1_9FLAO
MKIFREKQFINRWWLFMFILAVLLIIVGTAYYATLDAKENTQLLVSIISIAIALPIVAGLLYLRLETRIDREGITTWFKPFGFTKKHFEWKNIKECHVRQYNSVKEFGGWGLRGLGSKSKAYEVSGNKGIQIITNDDEKFLIGTQRPAAAKEIIKIYHPSTVKKAPHEI